MPSVPSTRRSFRWWLLAVVLVLATGSLSFIRLTERIEPTMRNPLTIMVTLGTLFLLTLWFVLLSGLRWRSRLLGLAVVLALAASAPLLLRVEGYTGDLLPLLTWRWKPVKDSTLPDLTQVSRELGTTPVDLKTTFQNDFHQFLSPQRRGIVTGVALAPDWSAQPPRQLWRQPIGAGWSAFAIVGPYAVTQEQRGDQEMVVF